MALIPCPKCGEQVSTYASKCPHCGEKLQQVTQSNDTTCPECGTHFAKGLAACPNCGEPNKRVAVNKAKDPAPSSPQTLDLSKILYTVEDEFEEKTLVLSELFIDTESDDIRYEIADKLHASRPSIRIGHYKEKDESSFIVFYAQDDIKEAFEDAEMSDDLETETKGMIITVDGNDKIRLPFNEVLNRADVFSITDEDFLKCCNAKHLDFKICLVNGENYSVSVPEQKLLINYFGILYDYTTGSNIFPDSTSVVSPWVKKHYEQVEAEEKAQQAEEEAQQIAAEKEAYVETNKASQKQTIGIVLIAVGVILFLIGVSNFDSLSGIVFITAAVISILIGVCFIIFGNMKKKGYSDEEAWNKVNEVLSRLKR